MLRNLLLVVFMCSVVGVFMAQGASTVLADDANCSSSTIETSATGEVPCPKGKDKKNIRVACRIRPGVCSDGCIDCVNLCNEGYTACHSVCPSQGKAACKMGCKTVRAACREVCN